MSPAQQLQIYKWHISINESDTNEKYKTKGKFQQGSVTPSPADRGTAQHKPSKHKDIKSKK